MLHHHPHTSFPHPFLPLVSFIPHLALPTFNPAILRRPIQKRHPKKTRRLQTRDQHGYPLQANACLAPFDFVRVRRVEGDDSQLRRMAERDVGQQPVLEAQEGVVGVFGGARGEG